MKKLLILVIALAVVWAIPAARARFVLALQPVFERLGPVGDRMMAPARKYGAKTEAQQFLHLLTQDRNAGKRLPDARTFSGWVESNTRESNLDPWGQPYWLKVQKRNFSVGSNGPDGERNTPDDIVKSAVL